MAYSLLWFFFLLSMKWAFSAKIAGFSAFAEGSHYFLVGNILEELASRGHEVVAVVPCPDERLKSSEKIQHKCYKVPGISEESWIKNALKRNQLQSHLSLLGFQQQYCNCLLNDTKLLQDLESFDLIFHETIVLCAVLVGDLFNLPRVATSPGPGFTPFEALVNAPFSLSYAPIGMTGFSNKMTFFQRLINLGTYIAGRLFAELYIFRSFNAIKKQHGIKPEKSFQEAAKDGTELLIFRADFALDYPLPLLPGTVMVGPLTVKDVKPLPPDLEEFVSSSGGDGFIIVSFGSYLVSVLAKEEVDMLATAFGQLKQNVLWRLKGYIPANLSPNIKVVDWLPQNDLLGHKKIKAFVSHVGLNSLYESAYYGIPLVAIPHFADQFANAQRVEHFGIGLAVNYKTVDTKSLAETIHKVTSEPRFKEAALRVSRLLKDRRRTPVQETADWIEYVIRHGGASHLRPQVFNISWYQYYLLDIMAFAVAMVTLVVIVIGLIFKCLCHVCCRRGGDNKAKKE